MEKFKFERALAALFAGNNLFTPREVYAAVARVKWVHEKGQRVRYSDRQAAIAVSNMIRANNRFEEDNNFFDLYCSGKEGVVTPAIRTALEEKGWRVA
jgi:hypothetical protein